MTVNIMVDLETWGTTPGSDLRSIGAVVFDPVTGLLGDEFYVNVEHGGEYGLSRDPSTEKWWSEQSPEARARLEVDVRYIRDGLVRFSNWWGHLDVSERQNGDYIRFWAHGPHFDESILGACYRATEIDVPWHYRAPRDCRTIWDAAGGIDLPFEGTEHNALDDAKHQARCVIEAYRRLRPTNTRVSELLEANNREVERRRALQNAIEGLGAMPDGYCFCSAARTGQDDKLHQPECRDLRALLVDA